MPFPEEFRTCTVTGLRVHLAAEKLIVTNVVTAVLALTVGGLFALLIALTRMPAVKLLDANLFYMALTGHGIFMLIVWMIFFEVGAMYFVSTVLLNARIFSKNLGWLAYLTMLLGAVLVAVTVLTQQANVTFTAYVPLMAHPVFYLGYIIFAVGALLGVINFVMTLVQARLDGALTGSLPLVTYGVTVAAILAVLAIISGVVALVPAFLWSAGVFATAEPIVYRTWFWGLGHTLQYVNVTAMIASWYALAALTMGASPINEKYTRVAFIIYLLVTVPVLGHHFLVDPTLTPAVKIFGGSIMGFILGIPSLMHGLAVLGSMEIKVRREDRQVSLFGWLRKLPWGHPGMAALLVSMFLLGIGGFNGTVATTYQLNMVSHNNTWVPAHLHGTVVGGATIAFMGLSYLVVPLMVRRELFSQGMARLQPYLYGLGLLVMILSLNWAGFLDVPRRVPDIAYPGAPDWFLPMNIFGIGALVAITGGALFVINMVLTLVAGKRFA